MRKIKVFVSYIMVLAILLTLIPFKAASVHAAAGSNLSVQSYRYNTVNGKYELTLTWQGNKSAKNANIKYHDDVTGAVYNSANVPAVEIAPIDLSTSRFSATFDVSNLNENFLYNIQVSMFDINSSQVGSGFVYFITGMSFTSERVENPRPTGVFESGTSPELKLSWQVPRIWTTSGFLLVTDPAAIAYMNSVLNPSKPISKIDFKINISTKAQTLDSGADISPVFIQNVGGSYKATDASDTVGKNVPVDASDYMSLNLVGRKDTTDSPDYSTDPSRLYHSQIMPGTVYFMNVKPSFINTDNQVADVFTLGDPAQYNGSLVRDLGSGLGYTYTPVRFNISRDAFNNIYVTAYKINNGSVDMPNLYYSIQAIDTPISTYGVDWPEKARMTDQFFPSGSLYAVTVITGIDVNTPMYYKVVVKTDSKADRIESLKVLYKMSSDTSKPPIPINVKADMSKSTLVTGNVKDPATGAVIVDQYSNPLNVRSTDILLTWDKPSNYDTMSPADKADLVYHVMINTNVENLKMKYPLKFAGLEKEYLLNYRWVKAISATDPGIVADGNKLTYRLKGFELFKNIDGTPISNPDKYPDWLVENTIYYVKMFTTKAMDASKLGSMSDLTGDGVIDEADFKQYAVNAGIPMDTIVSYNSVAASFTTLPGYDKQVPVPMGFKATGEDIDSSTNKNYINLQFDRSTVDWTTFTSSNAGNQVFYELFMASGSADNPQYVQIGSTDPSFTPASTDFTKAQITLVNGVWSVLVPNLTQNTRYRFKLRLKLKFGDPAISALYSEFTSVVSVTTRKIEILAPNPATQIPLAPTDFNIGKTSDGKDDLSGTGVRLDWSILEDNNVDYELVVTTARIDPNADTPDFANDVYYKSFITKFTTGAQDDVRDLNPRAPGGSFNADLTTKLCKYRVDRNFMTPNNIYFYSLRAKRTVTDPTDNSQKTLHSKWVTVPVTTSMIEAPLELENVPDYQLGVSWTDNTPEINADNYTIYMKKSSETTYKPLDITKVTIIKDNDGQTYYARIRGLDSGTSYDIGAFKGTDVSNLNFEKTWTLTTRDEYHNVEVRWKCLTGVTYEIAMRDESTGEYTPIASSDLTIANNDFVLENQEKSQELVGTGYYYFYARIKQMPVKLSTETTSLTLTSNTKYYIKVRATQAGQQPSKYAGPVTARTSFLQSEYDDKENLNNVTAKLVDKIDNIEKTPYYQLNPVLSTTNTVLLKGDRLAEELQASPYHGLKIDLTSMSSAGRVDEVYIPQTLAQALKSTNGSIDFVLDKAEYTLVSAVLDESTYNEAADLKKKYNEKELWFKLTVSRPDGGTEGIDAKVTPVSPVNIPELNILGVGTKYSDLKSDFVNKVYNSETGLVKQQKDQLKDIYAKNPDSFLSQGSYLVDVLVDQVRKELSDYVKSSVEGGNGSAGIILGTAALNEFSAPVISKVYVNKSADYLQPYGLYMDGSGSNWNKLSVLDKTKNYVSFEIIKPGKYFVGVSGNFSDSVPKSNWAHDTIVNFNNKYNIADVFTASGDFNPDAPVSIKESILILDKVFSKDSINGELLQKKVSKLGLSSYFDSISPVRDLSREQAATLYVMSYCAKNGLSMDSLKPSGVVVFNDAANISQTHFNNAENAVAFGFMTSDANGSFNPAGYVTRAEFITSLNKALQ